jgi:hypothetical protein
MLFNAIRETPFGEPDADAGRPSARRVDARLVVKITRTNRVNGDAA